MDPYSPSLYDNTFNHHLAGLRTPESEKFLDQGLPDRRAPGAVMSLAQQVIYSIDLGREMLPAQPPFDSQVLAASSFAPQQQVDWTFERDPRPAPSTSWNLQASEIRPGTQTPVMFGNSQQRASQPSFHGQASSEDDGIVDTYHDRAQSIWGSGTMSSRNSGSGHFSTPLGASLSSYRMTRFQNQVPTVSSCPNCGFGLPVDYCLDVGGTAGLNGDVWSRDGSEYPSGNFRASGSGEVSYPAPTTFDSNIQYENNLSVSHDDQHIGAALNVQAMGSQTSQIAPEGTPRNLGSLDRRSKPNPGPISSQSFSRNGWTPINSSSQTPQIPLYPPEELPHNRKRKRKVVSQSLSLQSNPSPKLAADIELPSDQALTEPQELIQSSPQSPPSFVRSLPSTDPVEKTPYKSHRKQNASEISSSPPGIPSNTLAPAEAANSVPIRAIKRATRKHSKREAPFSGAVGSTGPATEVSPKPKKKRRQTGVAAKSTTKNIEETRGSSSGDKSVKVNRKQPTLPLDPDLQSGGRFTQTELRLLDEAISAYRDLHHMAQSEVNDLVWGNARAEDFPSDFWDGICGALPHRTRHSVQKAAKRKYNNKEKKGSWTAEEDDDLLAAYELYPDKWIKIGVELGRTGEACRDRWRNYTRNGKDMARGPWHNSEETEFLEIVKDLLGKIRSDHDKKVQAQESDSEAEEFLADDYLDFNVISKRMNGKRSRLQCANKWRKIKSRPYARAIVDSQASSSADATPSQPKKHKRRKTSSSFKNRIVPETEKERVFSLPTPGSTNNDDDDDDSEL